MQVPGNYHTHGALLLLSLMGPFAARKTASFDMLSLKIFITGDDLACLGLNLQTLLKLHFAQQSQLLINHCASVDCLPYWRSMEILKHPRSLLTLKTK